MSIPTPPESPLTREDRLAADVFQKSYRAYLALKSTHYRWYHLAPQGVHFLGEARDRSWSMEKLADYLHCPVDEASACYRRFLVSEKVNAKKDTAARIRQAFMEWVGQFGEMEERQKELYAQELSLIVANHLYAAALAKEDPEKLSRELEGREPPSGVEPSDSGSRGDGPAGDTWGPQWKD